MKVCILGGGLTGFTLAKALINMGVYVDVFFEQHKKQNMGRTLGLSKSNIEFFNSKILNIEKLLWDIDKIEIFSENFDNKKILDFENNNQTLFSIIKNSELSDYLLSVLKKSNFIKFKKKLQKFESIKEKYQLIINCEKNNLITKKFFFKKLNKNYFSYAHTAIISHKKKTNNKTACQIFTKKGPIAFLPISDSRTSIVYSVKGNRNLKLKELIRKYNTKYEIIDIKDVNSFELKSSHLRTYHHKNILAFGDLLHKIHPLAGQGFNMTVRDIKDLTSIIEKRINLGLDLDSSICLDFEKHSKHKNYIFENGVDFIYEFFNLENKINTNILSKTVKFLGKRKFANSFFAKFADYGLQFKNY